MCDEFNVGGGEDLYDHKNDVMELDGTFNLIHLYENDQCCSTAGDRKVQLETGCENNQK